MYVVLGKVRIKSGRYDEALQMLNSDVVPKVKGAPGFVRGTWFGDNETGHGLAVFESAEQAQELGGMMTFEDNDPVELLDTPQVWEVHAQA